MEVINPPGFPSMLKVWHDPNTEIEKAAMNQLLDTIHLPFIHKHVAVMPDVHWGLGATVGTVLPTKGAIVPAAVGVDIGCGMNAALTPLTANDMPDNLAGLRSAIEAIIPHGRTDNGGAMDRGSWGNPDTRIQLAWAKICGDDRFVEIMERHPKLRHARGMHQIGTLGTGNHFVEICLDEQDRVWVMLHSGSRGQGNTIGRYFIEQAKIECERWHVPLPNKDLAFLPERTDLFDDYVKAVSWAQDYARLNRHLMMEAAFRALGEIFGYTVLPKETVISCHHNYVEREHHFGENVWVTRKGAVRAREGDLGIIPGSMGAKSFIVEGLGNPDSFHTCSHGAGRRMSRRAARETFTVEDHVRATAGIECRKDEGVLDETPGAYKDIDAVMAAQSDLVRVRHTLRQIVCVKG